MASAIYVLDSKGKLLISRNFRGDVPLNIVDRFVLKLNEEDEDSAIKPVWQEDGISYMWVRHGNLIFLAVSNKNSNVSMVIMFLHKLVEVLVDYFKELEEESIRDNFVLVYELLDEMMDFGYPQTTESKVLQEFILQESHKLEVAVRPPPALTNAVSWRSEGIKYRKNEVFLDCIEQVNLLVNANGSTLRSEILGCLKMKTYLSGMPELRLGLNDRVTFDAQRAGGPQASGARGGRAIEMEDLSLHQCVRLNRFDNDRTISFIPPDGEFELMSYRLNTQVKPLIWIEAVVDSHKHSSVEYLVKARSQFKQRSMANNVEIIIPVPPDADSPKFRTNMGTVRYVPERDAAIWTIRQFPGGREFLMRAHFGLPSISNDEEREKKPPIQVRFEIPYFTVSGMQVRYLKIVERSGYQAMPWVRYLTTAKNYEIRMN